MDSKQVLAYGALESTTHNLRSVFVRHTHFKKIMKFESLLQYFAVA